MVAETSGNHTMPDICVNDFHLSADALSAIKAEAEKQGTTVDALLLAILEEEANRIKRKP